MRKRIFSLLLSVCLLFSVLPFPVLAKTVQSGSCGDNLSWKLSDSGTLTISGTGKMDDYYDQSPPWYTFQGKIKTLKVKEGVTSIGHRAFEFCDKLSSVSLPDSLVSIGDYAFSNCPIKKISLPPNLETLHLGAFTTTKLTSIKLPSKLKFLGPRVFSGTRLKTVTIPASVTTIDHEQGSPFFGIDTLESISVSSKNKNYCAKDDILFSKDKTVLIQYPQSKSGSSYSVPSSVKVLGDFALSGTKLKKVVLPEGLETIGLEAFHASKKIAKLSIPSTVKKIVNHNLGYCASLEAINVSKNNTHYSSLDGVLFNKDQTLLIRYPIAKEDRYYTVPNTVTTIEGGAFSYNDYLVTLTFPDSVKNIGNYIVDYCHSLQMVVFQGDAPECGPEASMVFGYHGEAVYYPYNNPTWTDQVIDELEDDGDGASLFAYDPAMAAPNVTATSSASSGKPKLTWDAVEGASCYAVYRSGSKYGSYSCIGSTSDTTYTDVSAKAGKKYYYKVESRREDVRSLYSDPDARTCDLPQPDVTAKRKNNGDPKLSWKKIGGVKEYRIYRSTSKNGTYTRIRTTTATAFTDTAAKAGKTYYYKVKAIHKNSSANSAYSTIFRIKSK